MLGMSQTRIREKAGTTGITSVGQSVITSDTADEIKSIIDVGIADVEGLDAALDGLDLALDSKADLVGGFVPTSQIPAIAISEFLGSVANEAAMLALTGDRGDWCIRADTGLTYVLKADDSSLVGSWQAHSYPAAPVTTVNGQTGVVVLGADDVGASSEGHDHDDAYDAIGAAAAVASSLGTMSTQAANLVNITGGTIAGITDLAIADGGTGASNASGARTNLGLVIGTDVLAPNGSASGLSGLPDAMHQFALSGSTYILPIAGLNVASYAVSKSVEYAHGVYLARSLTISGLRFVLASTPGGGMVARVAIKPINADGKPGNPLWASGELACDTTGPVSAPVSMTLSPGWYALTLAFFNGSAGSPAVVGGIATMLYPVWGRTLSVSGSQPVAQIYRTGATNVASPDTSASTWVENVAATAIMIGFVKA